MGLKERRAREGTARLDAILGAAEKVFARDGYQQARMDDIAATAELSKGTLYYYFKSKDAIFVRLLEREADKVFEEIRRRIAETSSFHEALDQTVRFYLEECDVVGGVDAQHLGLAWVSIAGGNSDFLFALDHMGGGEHEAVPRDRDAASVSMTTSDHEDASGCAV